VKLANLRLLHGQSGVFGDFTITASIGSTQACAEVNSLSPFIVAILPDTTTTTAPGGCTQDADCADDGDPCFSEACIGGTCQSSNIQGLAGAACVCQRSTVAACTGQVPANVNAQTKKACKSIGKASAGNAKKAKKLLKAAAKAFKKAKARAAKAAKKKKGKVLPPDCATAVGAQLDDAVDRSNKAAAAP
jgi:hypothetical protein